MAKKEIKNIHIGEDTWKYVVENSRDWNEPKEIRIYDPQKKLTRVKSDIFLQAIEAKNSDQIKPSDVKKYIEDFLT